MANIDDKFPENVDGAYYVDEQCIACGLCPTEASNNFTMTDDDSYAYVFKQPENDEQKQDCKDALEGCPVDAIGNDGKRAKKKSKVK